MQPEDGRLALARRLRSLRRKRALRQVDVANALGVSAPLISSWENERDLAIPDDDHLINYAGVLASEEDRDDLSRELIQLRTCALGMGDPSVDVGAQNTDPDALWRFPDGAGITIVCGAVPPDAPDKGTYTDPLSPDYIALYNYADPDSLIELYGHIRATNPTSSVRYQTGELAADRYQDHLVFLGGIDWNSVLPDLLLRINLPVQQLGRETVAERGGFRKFGEGPDEVFVPELVAAEHGSMLVADVAHFVRGVSPYNSDRTVTICNGSYGRGVYGAVRALTDPLLKEKNAKYLLGKLSGKEMLSVLMRVLVSNKVVVTPNLTDRKTRLHEWSR